MKNKKNYNLIPYHNNIVHSQKETSLNKEIINNVKETIIKIVKYCDSILIHECNHFQNFSGRDIDTFYIPKNKFLDIILSS